MSKYQIIHQHKAEQKISFTTDVKFMAQFHPAVLYIRVDIPPAELSTHKEKLRLYNSSSTYEIIKEISETNYRGGNFVEIVFNDLDTKESYSLQIIPERPDSTSIADLVSAGIPLLPPYLIFEGIPYDDLETISSNLGKPKPSLTMPEFHSLQTEYPNGTSEEAKAAIGGGALADYVKNTCAIRLSRCLNKNGIKIPKGGSHFVTIVGSDKDHYALRVKELSTFLRQKLGKPDIDMKMPKHYDGKIPSEFVGQQGIIQFEISGWNDASGHLDLWNGYGCVHECYWKPNPPAVLVSAKLWLASKWKLQKDILGEPHHEKLPIVSIGRLR